MLAFASGALAIVMITASVVTATPQSSQQAAFSATTLPPFVTSPPGPATTAEAPNRIGSAVQLAEPKLLLASFTPIPNEIASAPQVATDEPEIADEMPATDDSVMAQTEDVTYHCTWEQIHLIDLPDGTVVVDVHGDLIAHVEGGDLVALVASMPTDTSLDD
jgi:hypothetical protein